MTRPMSAYLNARKRLHRNKLSLTSRRAKTSIFYILVYNIRVLIAIVMDDIKFLVLKQMLCLHEVFRILDS